MKYIIGIDIGTTNTKAVAFDVNGQVLAQHNKTYSFISPQEGFHELDPAVLFDAVLEVMKRVVIQSASHQLQAVSFSSAMHGLIAVDNSGKPLTNMITWADLRSSEQARQLRESPLAKKLYERTGTPVHPMTPLCKLMWMKDNLPAIFNSAHKFISIKEYVFFHFFGEFIVDRSVASSTGMFDIYGLDWNEDALKTAGITANRLSRHVESTYIIKGLQAEYVSKLNIKAETPFVIGASDGCLAHLGCNALKPMDVSVTIGTSGAVRIMTEKTVYDPHERLFNYLLTDRQYISGGPLNNGGNVLQWFAKNFLKKDFLTSDDFESFIAEAMTIQAGCEGLVFLPYIYGERAPVWDADARGIFYGVSAIHTIEHFMRALMEGVCFGLLSILNSIEEVAGEINDIYASGGFIRSSKWLQLLADVFGKKINITQAEDSSAAGAVLLAMKALGDIDKISEMHGFFADKESFEPDMENHRACLANYAVYANLYESFKNLREIKK